MKKKLLPRYLQLVAEFVLVSLLAFFTVYAGQQRLKDWNGPAGSLTNDLFIPAILLNAGQGFTNVAPGTLPDLRAFLDFRSESFDLQTLPEDIDPIDLHPFQEYHRYLIYAVACVWHFQGITWDAMKVLILAVFCAAVFCVYFICRLGMNPVLSFGAALGFVYAQPVLWTLPILRDFAKAPFVLALIYLLGITIRKRVTPIRYFMLAGLVGLVLGIGMGFRRDMMVFVPVCVFFLLLCKFQTVKHPFSIRFTGTGILLALYVISGWPIHKALYRDGYVAAHDTIMGFASYSDYELGLIKPASYEKHYLLNDLFCTLKAHDLAKRGVTFPEAVYKRDSNDVSFDLKMKQAYVEEIIQTFPADMLTRAYAAVLRLATSIVSSKNMLAAAVEKYGLWFLAVGLLLLACQQARWAWLTLILLCYFCGYTSIQFAFRHAFHMSFVPYFFAGLCLQHAFVFVWVLFRCLLQKSSHSLLSLSTHVFPKAILKASMWAIITVALLYAPLALARVWQKNTVATLHDSYTAAQTTPIPHRSLTWNERTVFMPTAGRHCHLCQNMGLIVDIETRFLSASFEGVQEDLDIDLIYEWEGLSWDFSAPATFALRPSSETTAVDFYFPVHEVTTCTNWNHFVGISVPLEQSHLFRGFHQVEDLSTLGLLINMAVPAQQELFIPAQYLTLPWFGTAWHPYRIYEEFNPFLVEMEIKRFLNQGDYERALTLVDQALSVRPHSIQFTFLRAEILDKAGHSDQALEECKELLTHYPDTFVLYARLDRYFHERGGPQRCLQEWSSLVQQNPALTCARHYLEAAQKQVSKENTPVDNSIRAPEGAAT